MKKIGSLDIKNLGTLCIYYCPNRKHNRYAIYVEGYYQDDKHDWPTKHRKLIQRYGNLSSCTAFIHQCVVSHDEEER